MHDLPLITTISAAFTAAWLLGLLAQRIGLSPIVGYLLAGVIIGPHTPGFVGDVHLAQQLAEVGVILLMFDVGLHFSLKKLLAVRSVAIPGAIGQSLVATLLGVLICVAFGFSTQAGMIVGMAMAVASTVVLMRVLMEAQVLDTPQGHVAVGWLLVEDIFTVIVLVLIPAMGGDGGEHGADHAGGSLWLAFGAAMLKLAVLVVLVMLAGSRLIPWVLVRVARLRSRELFTLTVLVFSVAIAAASYVFFGASMALGAFLAGMVVAQSPVSHQAAADALPMRDTFAVIFFVSVGMLFDPSFLWKEPLLILAGLGVILIAKPLTALVIVAVLGHSARTSLTVAIGLGQIGEFSFVLSELARQYGLMPDAGQNMLIAAAIITISLNPLLFRSLGDIEQWLQRRPRLWNLLNARAEKRMRDVNRDVAGKIADPALQNGRLAVVVGYGPVGRSVHSLLQEAGVETVIVEMNMDSVIELTDQGRPAIFGDAAREAILIQAGIKRATHLVVTLPHSSQRIAVVAAARYLNPQLRILVRAHYLAERDSLENAGATRAVFEEGEVAVALARLVLADTGANRETMERSLRDLRLRLILENVSNLKTHSVRGIMVPWTRVARLRNNESLQEVRHRVAERRYSRWPVVEPASGRPLGYLLAKDLIADMVATEWTRLLRPLHSVAPDDDIESTLLYMQQEGATVCAVEDNEIPVGLITIEDILEQVVGRIEDEYPRQSAIVLRDLFAAGGIVPEIKARTLDEAIAELAAVISPSKLPPGVDITELAIAREHQLSTHVGQGVAMPHAACRGLSSPLGVFGRSSTGISVTPDTKESVHFVFLLVTPTEEPDMHVYLLGQLASVAGKAEVRDALLSASTSEQMMSIIAAADPAAKVQAEQSAR